LETEAKLFIQELIYNDELELVWSFFMDYENDDNPFEEIRNNIAVWKSIAVIDCDLCDEITAVSKDIILKGLKPKDATHIACAIYGYADYFITTDKKILNKRITKICVINPIEFVRRYFNEQ
jgi:predicted nucleic acid-binding protein